MPKARGILRILTVALTYSFAQVGASAPAAKLMEKSRVDLMKPLIIDSAAIVYDARELKDGKIELNWCNGVMIAPKTVVSAAHCFRNGEKTSSFGIKERIKDFKKGLKFKRIFIHESYKHDNGALVGDLGVGCLEESQSGAFVSLAPQDLKISDAEIDKFNREAVGSQEQLLATFTCAEPIGSADFDCKRHDVLYLKNDNSRKSFSTTASWDPDVKKGESGSGFFLTRGKNVYVAGILAGIDTQSKFAHATDLRSYRDWILEKSAICEKK